MGTGNGNREAGTGNGNSERERGTGSGNGKQEVGTGNWNGSRPRPPGTCGERPVRPGSGPRWVLGAGDGGSFPPTGQGWLEPALTEETLDK